MIALYITMLIFILFVFSGFKQGIKSVSKELCPGNFEYNGKCYKYYEVNPVDNNGENLDFKDKDGNLLVLTRDNLPNNFIFISDSPEIVDTSWIYLRIFFRKRSATSISGDISIFYDNNDPYMKATRLQSGESVPTSNYPYSSISSGYPQEYVLGFVHRNYNEPENKISGNLKILLPIE